MAQLEGPKRYVPFWPVYHAPAWLDDLAHGETGPHDAPFENGISGVLEIEIEAITPLFVGAKQTGGENEAKTKRWLEIGNSRCIAGTSIKGMIRSVIETATFGRFGDRIDDRRLSIRDLYNKQDYIDHLSDMFRPKSKAGWLKVDRTGWRLRPCEWSLVKQEDLERFHKKNVYLGKRAGAMEKYKAWGWDNREVMFDPLSPSKEGSYANGREVSRISNLGSGNTHGTIVLTGQPNDRKRAKKAKSTDFIFHTSAPDDKDVPSNIRRDFEQIHRDVNGVPNDEWQVWLNRARSTGEEVPIFWLENPDGSIKAMGLAMMFRLAYNRSLHEAGHQNSSHALSGWDFADLLFGQVLEDRAENPKNLNLRGRANFGVFEQSNDVGLADEEKAILLAPKYGYYPALIRQDNIAGTNPVKVGNYTTLQDSKAKLRGPSRYMASRSAEVTKPDNNMSSKDTVFTKFRPVKAGATFRGKLQIFNVKPEELGALVWALHWGGQSGDLLTPSLRHAHMCGGAKVFGFGACRVRIDLEKSSIAVNPDYRKETGAEMNGTLKGAVDSFVTHMDAAMSKLKLKPQNSPNWLESLQIRELMNTADLDLGDRLRVDGKLRPMTSPKMFSDAKKDRLALPLPGGGYEVSLSAQSAPNTRHKGTRNQKPAARAPSGFRAGQRAMYINEGVEVTVLEDAPANAPAVRIQFDEGDEDSVPASSLTAT